MTSLGIAGAVSAYAAILGPAAAGITLGAAATGIGMERPVSVGHYSQKLCPWNKEN